LPVVREASLTSLRFEMSDRKKEKENVEGEYRKWF
jgi:hypothetical protein